MSVTRNSAPSNIALIKYMGKISGFGNKPTNASISYSLEHLRTEVEIVDSKSGRDQWEPLRANHLTPIELNERGREKFLKHLMHLKSVWGLEDKNFLVRSANNFPSDCGLASSASSFSALTKTAAEHFQQIKPKANGNDPLYLSQLSRLGSGSSCRSFFSPWAIWKEEGAEPIDLNLKLHSAVIILEEHKKAVSSSEAHVRVLTSPRFQGRIERAELKLKDLISAIQKEQWKEGYDIVWDEFWDMHELFHTSKPEFSYMTKQARDILQSLESQWKKSGHGPWITLDAGPNIHLLFLEEELAFAKTYMEQFKNFKTICSWGRS